MKEFITLLIGNQSLAMFAALFFFAIVGVAINLLIHATSRDQNSKNTPEKFSFVFLLKDNWKRIALGVLLILVSIRFVKPLFNVDTANQEIYLFSAMAIGFLFDKLAEKLKEKTDFLKVERQPEAQV